jgi:hypothetical protein
MSTRRRKGLFLNFACALLTLAAIAGLSACHRKPSEPALAPELAAIACPADSAEHARATIGNAKVLFLCIPKDRMAAPNKIGCNPNGVIRTCDVVNEIQLSHRAGDSRVHAGSIYDRLFIGARSEAEKEGDSQLYVIFHEGPPTSQTFGEIETPTRFLLADGDALLPPGFTFVKGTQCDRQSTVLNTGICNMEAQTASLYWHISITIWHNKGTDISPSEYRKELAFWMPYLEKMVDDPKTASAAAH